MGKVALRRFAADARRMDAATLIISLLAAFLVGRMLRALRR